jgi:hypothetical protein
VSAEQKFVRQIQLAEVGVAGQLAIGEAALTVDADADQGSIEFAKIYGNAAGLDAVRVVFVSQPLPQGLQNAFRYPTSRSVGLGAAFALRTVLSALQLPIDSTVSS